MVRNEEPKSLAGPFGLWGAYYTIEFTKYKTNIKIK